MNTSHTNTMLRIRPGKRPSPGRPALARGQPDEITRRALGGHCPGGRRGRPDGVVRRDPPSAVVRRLPEHLRDRAAVPDQGIVSIALAVV